MHAKKEEEWVGRVRGRRMEGGADGEKRERSARVGTRLHRHEIGQHRDDELGQLGGRQAASTQAGMKHMSARGAGEWEHGSANASGGGKKLSNACMCH